MEKEIAIKLMDSLSKVGNKLNDAAQIIELIEDVGEKRKYKMGIGDLMGRLYTERQRHIIREHNELDPDL